ncbi:hypothetical protein Tco_0140626 [Tanacetum coccineum]
MKSRKRRFKQILLKMTHLTLRKRKDELRLLTIAPDEDKEVDESKKSEEINMNVVTRSNGQKRYFNTLIRVLLMFDREDLDAVYKLVIGLYIKINTSKVLIKFIWGDLIVMFNLDEQDEFWSSQHEWKVVSWKLHSSSGVHTLMTDEGLVVHMLIEKKYHLKKEILIANLKLKLNLKKDTMALELIRFIKKVLADLESKE